MHCVSVFKLRVIHVAQRSDLDCNVRLAHALSLPNASVATCQCQESTLHDHWQISSESCSITNTDEHLHWLVPALYV